jgi:uncharacterized protein
MQHRRGLFLMVGLALAGIGVIAGLPYVVTSYDRVAAVNPALGYAYLGAVALIGLLIVVGVVRLVLAGRRRRRLARPAERMRPAEKVEAIEHSLARARRDAEEATPDVREQIEVALAKLDVKMESRTLEVAAVGTISSGKSSVLNALAGRDVFQSDVRGGTTTAREEIPWPGADRVILVDTPGLAEVGGEERALLAVREAEHADVVVFVVDGPLKNFEHDAVRALTRLGKRVVLCFNKSDWLGDADREAVLRQIRTQVQGYLTPDDVVPVRSRPAMRPRMVVAADGSEREEEVAVPADIAPLAERLAAIVTSDGRDLLLGNLLLRSRGLAEEARAKVQARLDQRAAGIVNQAMWIAGGAAAAIPVPVIDIAGSLAVQVKMVLDLARVYNRPLDLGAARDIVAELVQSGLATTGAAVAAPAIATVAGSALKTIPLAGTLAGGIFQGLVQALITRWIGRSCIAYFRDGERASLAEAARREWTAITRPAELAKLVQEGATRIGRRQSPAVSASGRPEEGR